MKRIIIFSLSVLIAWPVFAQQEAWQKVSQAVQEVQIKDDIYQQSFTYEADNQCLVTVTILDTDEGEEMVYKVNAADLNEHKIRFDTRSREVKVEVETRGRKELIQVFENGEPEEFTEGFEIYATGIENAREIVQSLKEVVTACGEQSKEVLVNGSANPSFEEALGFLSSEIREVEISGGAFKQSFTYDSQNPTIITYEYEDTEEEESNQYIANVKDFNEQSVSFNTKQGNVWVLLETIGGRDLIQTYENGELDDYGNEVQIMATDIEQARVLEKALKRLIATAEQRYDNSFLPGNSNPDLGATATFLADHISEVSLGKEIYEQSFSYDATTQQLQYEVIEVGDGEQNAYKINPADINPNTISFDTKGSEVLVELTTQAERDLVQELEDGVVEGYTDEITMYAPSIEEARRWVGALQHLVTLAQSNQQDRFSSTVGENPNAAATHQFLTENVGQIDAGDERYQQTINTSSDNSCLLTYSIIDEDDGKEEVFEWNMADINSRLITFDTKGEDILITLTTTAKRDLIREMEEGELEGYENEVELRANSIDEARALVSAFKHLADLCNK